MKIANTILGAVRPRALLRWVLLSMVGVFTAFAQPQSEAYLQNKDAQGNSYFYLGYISSTGGRYAFDTEYQVPPTGTPAYTNCSCIYVGSSTVSADNVDAGDPENTIGSMYMVQFTLYEKFVSLSSCSGSVCGGKVLNVVDSIYDQPTYYFSD